MTVAVLGGAGFIGSNLVDELLSQGQDVTVLDNLSEGKLANLKRWSRYGKLEFVRGDIRDFETVRRVCDHKDWVFHLAAMSRIQPSITDPLLAWQQNIIGTGNVLEACRQGGVKRVVYSASSSAYGLKNDWALNPDQLAATREDGSRVVTGLTEDMPTDCLNPYSLSKKVGEEMMELYRKLYGLSTVSLRYFNVYGPRHQEEGSYATVIAIFRRQKRLGQPLTVVGDGTKRRDFTFVSDVVRANIMAAMNYAVGGVINIGTGVNHSINEVASLVLDCCGKHDCTAMVHMPDRPAEALVTLANGSRAWNELGWKSNVTLPQGLAVLDLYEKKNSPGLILTA